MNVLQKHEIFEIEVLNQLKSAKFLEPLVFGGGTMLRLCYDLNRYSVDLDFWFIRKMPVKDYFKKLHQYLKNTDYDITDAQIKFYTLLFEIRSKNYPRRLKIEIRKALMKCDFQERIAFSQYSTKQVIMRVHTLEQAMKNKIEAALERKAIRDFFDLEFLLRQGITLNTKTDNLKKLLKKATSFSANDFKVALGSLLDTQMRHYYIENKFEYLEKTILKSLS
ncbi:MAG: nucleotidyl transferase AbiEii/AbiGii toxin family protein [Candidatus Omnitrophota bacterium]